MTTHRTEGGLLVSCVTLISPTTRRCFWLMAVVHLEHVVPLCALHIWRPRVIGVERQQVFDSCSFFSHSWSEQTQPFPKGCWTCHWRDAREASFGESLSLQVVSFHCAVSPLHFFVLLCTLHVITLFYCFGAACNGSDTRANRARSNSGARECYVFGKVSCTNAHVTSCLRSGNFKELVLAQQ